MIVITVYTVVMVVSYFLDWHLRYLILDFVMYSVSSTIFLYALFHIRRTIKALEDAFPNEWFMLIHAINFIVFILISLITFILSMMYARALSDETSDEQLLRRLRLQKWCLVANNIQLPFQAYFDLFVLYLILRNTKRHGCAEGNMNGKNVQNIVFLKNRQYLRDVLQHEFEN